MNADEATTEGVWFGKELDVKETAGAELDDLIGLREMADVGRGGREENTPRDEAVTEGTGIGESTLKELEEAPPLGRGTVLNELAVPEGEAGADEALAAEMCGIFADEDRTTGLLEGVVLAIAGADELGGWVDEGVTVEHVVVVVRTWMLSTSILLPYT